jgi:hypothetical protein
MAEQVVGGFLFHDLEQTKVGQEIVEHELKMSLSKLSVSRTQIEPSIGRKDAIWTSAIWSDSLIATLLSNWNKFSNLTSRDFHRRFSAKLMDALLFNRLSVAAEEDTTFIVNSVKLEEITNFANAGESDEARGVLGILEATKLINQVDGLEQLLRDFIAEDQTVATYAGVALVARQLSGRDAGETPVSFLLDSGWRKAVFQGSAEINLNYLISFLSEWQLARQDEWRVRLPHLIAFEALECIDAVRTTSLFEWCVRCSLCVDIASPIVRLLTSDRRSDFVLLAQQWTKQLGYIATNSEPWAAYRIRGFVSKLQPHL